MTVTLSYALQNGSYVHISEKLQKEVPLYCPHCEEGVIAKKGTKMQHHFAHRAYSRCSASAETLLHFESKMYLKQLILQKAPVSFPAELALLEKTVQRWFTLLGSRHADISLLSILECYGIKNATEETGILGYIPDILGIGDESFAFEIYVTHALEEAKKEAFIRARVDYIELIPTRNEDGTFSYIVHDLHLPRFFTRWSSEITSNFEQNIKPELYDEFKQNEAVLVEKVKRDMYPDVLEKVCKDLSGNVEKFYLTRGEKLTRTQSAQHEVRVTPCYEEGEVLRLKEAYFPPGKNGHPYLVLKDGYKRSYTVDGTVPLFATLLNTLNGSYEIHMTTNEKDNVDGFIFVNTLDKLGFDQEVQQLLKRNLQLMQAKIDQKRDNR